MKSWVQLSPFLSRCLSMIGMLGLSHEFIKILDEEMDSTLDYMLMWQRRYWLKWELYWSDVWPRVNTVKDVEGYLDRKYLIWFRKYKKIENHKLDSQLIFHKVAVTFSVVPRTRYCPQQTQVVIAPNCGVFDLVVDHSYVNSTYVSRNTFYKCFTHFLKILISFHLVSKDDLWVFTCFWENWNKMQAWHNFEWVIENKMVINLSLMPWSMNSSS